MTGPLKLFMIDFTGKMGMLAFRCNDRSAILKVNSL